LLPIEEAQPAVSAAKLLTRDEARRIAANIAERPRPVTYVNWLQNAMSASPWTNADLNKKLLGYATENVTAAVGLVEKLSHAKNLEEVVKIQTEFVSKQLGYLNEQTKTIMEVCTKAAQDVTKRST
jgi:Phasin protein